MAAPQADHLDLRLIDEIADHLVDRLGDALVERVIEALGYGGIAFQAPAWLDANEVAQRLKVDRGWVYEHADELGVSRLGSGPRPRLRFSPDVLDSKSDAQARPQATRQPAKRERKPTGLIPIRSQ